MDLAADEAEAVLETLRSRTPVLWRNPARGVEGVGPGKRLSFEDVQAAEARLARFAPALADWFPELEATAGVIESPLFELPEMSLPLLGSANGLGRVLLKADHLLPIAGSIKARGGIHEVLELAERVAIEAGVLRVSDGYRVLVQPQVRDVFARHEISVGSTGNLGLSIGITAAAMGFRAVVHMSTDAKAWKKALLRERGVRVVEHAGDYQAAVAAGRREASGNRHMHFVDDERSCSLFLGYATAALRLKRQLAAQRVRVDEAHPLFVYLPCGVGGAPAGIAFGLHQLFGSAVHCFFAEPTASPCFLVGMLHPPGTGVSVYDVGLDNRTEADGLAVPRASELALDIMRPILSGIYTVQDATLLRQLATLHRRTAMRIEPSAAASLSGPATLLGTPEGHRYIDEIGLQRYLPDASHLVWTTGGGMVPPEDFDEFLRRGSDMV